MLSKSYKILVVLCFFTVGAFSQVKEKTVPNTQISGTVLDIDSKLPIEYASIIVFSKGDIKPITATATNKKGQFLIKGIDTGTYRLQLDFLGFKTKLIGAIQIDLKHQQIILNGLELEKTSKELASVTVTSSKRLVENKIDKIVYNAEKDLSSQGGVATDILKKVPMVSVDIDGNVELSGSSSIRFLINGKPSLAFGSNITEVLQSIPASQIKSVEVITNPGAKYDAQGLGGIINIILKNNKSKGYNTSINMSTGTLLENAAINFSARKNNFGLSAFVSGNERLLAATPMTMNRTTFDTIAKTTNYLQQAGSSDVKRHGYQSGLNLDWTYQKKNIFTTSIKGMGFGVQSSGFNSQEFNTQNNSGATINKIYLQNQTSYKFDEKNWEFEAAYKRKFDTEDKELEISFSSQKGNGLVRANSAQSQLPSDSLIYATINSNNFQQTENEVKIDFTQPLGHDIKWNMGGKINIQDLNSSTDVLSLASDQSYIYNKSLSNSLQYHQQVFAAYTELEFPVGKIIDVKLGGRYEKTIVDASFTQAANSSIHPNYSNFVPSIFLMRKISDTKNIRVSYSRRINRPGSEELNPFFNTTDPKNISTGNPYLLPERGARFEIAYHQDIMDKGSVMITLFSRNSDDDIQPYVVYYPSLQVGDTTYKNVNLTKRENIGLEKNTGINVYADFHFSSKLTFRTNIAYYHRHILNSIDPNYNTTSENYRANINFTYQISKNILSECFGNFNSARNEVQGKYPANASYSLAIRKQFWNKKGSLGLVANNPFSEYIQLKTILFGPNFNSSSIRRVPSRSFGISFTWRFGKLEFKKEQKEQELSSEGAG